MRALVPAGPAGWIQSRALPRANPLSKNSPSYRVPVTDGESTPRVLTFQLVAGGWLAPTRFPAIATVGLADGTLGQRVSLQVSGLWSAQAQRLSGIHALRR